MSSVTDIIVEVQDAARYIRDLLIENQGPLGIGFVGFNERLRREYPAVMVVPGMKEKIPNSTHKFLVGMEVLLLVFHGNLNNNTPDRTLEDLDLVTAIENLIEEDMTFGGKVVFAYVARTGPMPRPVTNQIVTTQMLIAIESRKGFPYVP